MSEVERRLAEDRNLRDAALQLFQSDLELIRGDLRDKGPGARIAARVGDAAMDVLDDALDYAAANKGKTALFAAAAVLWFARQPILEAAARLFAGDDDDAEPDEAGDRLPED